MFFSVVFRIPSVRVSHKFPSVDDHELVPLLVVSLLLSGILTTSKIVTAVAFVISGDNDVVLELDPVLTLMVPLLLITTTRRIVKGLLVFRIIIIPQMMIKFIPVDLGGSSLRIILQY